MLDYSICAIVKNESKNIKRFLDALNVFDCEKIILDTGSTDDTIEIANRYDCKVFNFTWINDFSAARNYASSLASHDWVLFLDCDEFVDETETSPSTFLTIAKQLPNGIGLLERVNLVNPDNAKGAYIDRVPRFYDKRLFEYNGKIHEQVVSKDNSPLEGFYIPLRVMHTGYLGTKKEKENKHLRNLTMLQNSLKDNPTDRYYNFQLGQEYYNTYQYETALQYFKVTVSDKLNPDSEYHRLALMGYSDCLLHSGRKKEAFDFINSYESDFANCPDYFYLRGLISFECNDYLHAMADFVSATSLSNPHKEGTNTYLPWFYIAQINEIFGNNEQALFFYNKCSELEVASKRIKELTS